MPEVYGQESWFNEDTKFFKDVYVYGTLHYEFENKSKEIFGDIEVQGDATFLGDVTFDFVTINRLLNVGAGGTTLKVDADQGRVGINSLSPEQSLDILGSAKIDEFIYDSVNSPGLNGGYLSRDAEGIRWITIEPSFSEGIFVQDEGVDIPITGTAQSFTALNFAQIDSLGIGSDNIIPIPDPSNPGFIAKIQSQDFWGVGPSTSIYRMTNVGIGNSIPSYTLDVNGTLRVEDDTLLDNNLQVTGETQLDDTLTVDGSSLLQSTLTVSGITRLNDETDSSDKDTGSLIVNGGVGIEKSLNVGGNTLLTGSLELDSTLIDVNGSVAAGKTDYRLASVGSGVSWRPPGVQTQNAIWVTVDGNDENTGLLEGDAKRTIGAAATVAQEGDTIFIRSGVYYENNPIGLRTDVTVSGQDLRLVTIVPNNVTNDVFHVRRGCLIENLNFAGSSVAVAHTGAGAISFPDPSSPAVSGYLEPGPATEGSSGRWRSPYIRNCTNFMSKSIGMKIDGDHATASTIGADLKSMVCDSFTQYNENGIGVSITNNGYAQLVSIFTINCDIGIFAATGGSCDLTNSNSSFGNYGLVAVGLGSTEFTGSVNANTTAENDTITLRDVFDGSGNPRRPYDGQALWFKINLDNYPDTVGSGQITAPLREVGSIRVLDGGSGFSAATPPSVVIRDDDGTLVPKGPQGIIAEASATVSAAGTITAIDIVSTGRNYLSTQNIVVDIDGNTGLATAVMDPIYFTVFESTEVTNSGITTTTFNEFVPYELFEDDAIELKRISRILTSSHSFEYIGTGTDINTSTPLKGAVPIKANEVDARDGAQIPFTSTDQKGNFDIGDGIQIDQTTSTIRGRDFSRAIQAEVTPLILALR